MVQNLPDRDMTLFAVIMAPIDIIEPPRIIEDSGHIEKVEIAVVEKPLSFSRIAPKQTSHLTRIYQSIYLMQFLPRAATAHQTKLAERPIPYDDFRLPGSAAFPIDAAARIALVEAMKYILLLIPCLLTVAVPFYNFDVPRLLGFPAFYWILFAQVPVSALFIYAAFRLDRAKGEA